MLIYWSLFLFFAFGAIANQGNPAYVYSAEAGRNDSEARRPPSEYRLFMLLGAGLIICLVGLRYRVGADWFTYEQIFATTGRYSFFSAIRLGDPAYQALNWVGHSAGLDIWFVNLVCAAIFGWGLYRFCRVQPLPWLAFAVAIPYMVIVVAMGYTRQAVALGILMAGLAKQIRGASTVNFAIYTAVAASFHGSAIIVFPIVALGAKGNRLVNFLLAVSVGLTLYNFFLGDAMDHLIKSYLDRDYSSQGALIRVVMNLVAAVAMWIFGRRLRFSDVERKIWRNFGLAAVGLAFLLAILSSSTAVDRLALYVMPLQIAVLARVPLASENRIAGTAAVLGYLFLAQYVWLNFAQHAQYWVPYQFYPL